MVRPSRSISQVRDQRLGAVQPYAVEREIEDIEALIDEAGGSALAFETALTLGGKIKIRKITRRPK